MNCEKKGNLCERGEDESFQNILKFRSRCQIILIICICKRHIISRHWSAQTNPLINVCVWCKFGKKQSLKNKLDK